jgi:methyl-accepting chemotaxis protein
VTSYEDLAIQKQALKDLKDAQASFALALADAKQHFASDASEFGKTLADVERLQLAVAPMLGQAVTLLQEAEYEQAKDFVYKQLRPLQAELFTAHDKAVNLLKAEAEQSVRASEQSFIVVLSQSCALTGLTLIGALLIGYLLTRTIRVPIRQAVELAKHVAAGDLSQGIHVTRTDEAGQLLHALAEMQEALRFMVLRVRESSETINTASGEIAAGNFNLSSRTQQQASSLEQTAASIEELTATVKQNADNAQAANQMATSASEVARRGGQVVEQVVATMSEISGSANKIQAIIGVIDGIAFQTNILALNAAVEAARAGEQGRGFAVVASEVRNLAQRSAAAAKQIKELVADSVNKVQSGRELVNTAGMTMTEVVKSVQRVTDIMSELLAASEEQRSGIKQVNQAVGQMDEMTQQNAALVEQSAATAASLKQQAGTLVEAISLFRLDADIVPTAALLLARPTRTESVAVQGVLHKEDCGPREIVEAIIDPPPPLTTYAMARGALHPAARR